MAGKKNKTLSHLIQGHDTVRMDNLEPNLGLLITMVEGM